MDATEKSNPTYNFNLLIMKDKIINEHERSELLNGRRNFLKMSGLAIAGTGLVLAGCEDDDNENDNDDQMPGLRNGTFDFGAGDIGILTYAYALEQMEADFATRVVNASNFTTTFNAEEQAMMSEIYSHEVIHREFFKDLLNDRLPDPENQLLPYLTFNYQGLNFNDRNAVLNAAKALEDIGIAAYNGAGRYITDENILAIAGKIVSLEGRHASAIASAINPDSTNFAPNALDPARKPSEILAQINALNYIETNFTAMYLP